VKLFQELRRRNVFKVGIAYAVTTWILLQLTDVVSEILVLPEWAPKLILVILLVGFLPALILAWAFEMTPEGIKLEKDVAPDRSITNRTGRKLNFTIMALLGLSLAYFIWESRFEQKAVDPEPAQNTITAEDAGSLTDSEQATTGDLAAATGLNENSIAVLPFTNRSADDNDIYFTDGIHDDLLTQLSKIDAFSVISRTSVLEYRDTTKNLRDIARELSVANVMEGSVQRAGDRVRINVQLIDAETDEHLWAEIYDRELTTSNLFDIQSEIAQNIADALEATLTDSEIASVGAAPTDNVAAYDLYLQARRFALGETMIGYQTALELYKEALKLDPEFKLAWIGLAQAHITNYWSYGGKPADRDLTREAIDRARSIDADFPELYMAEAFYWYWGHLDYDRALYNIDKAIEQIPGNNEAHMWRGWISRRAGLWEQALESMNQALRLNPRVDFNWVEYAATLAYLHRYQEARDAYTKARQVDPDSFWGKTELANLNILESGDIQSAITLTAGAQHADEVNFIVSYLNARLAARRFDEVLEVARNIPDEIEIQRNFITFREMWAAQILFFMDRKDEAKDAANAALFRLKNLRSQIGEDYRIDHAEAVISPMLGESPAEIQARISKSFASKPEDKVEDLRVVQDHARIYAMAGMTDEAIEILGPLFSPPSTISVHWVDLDPAFDGIRTELEFAALLDRHR